MSPPVAYESDADLEPETDSDFYDFEVKHNCSKKIKHYNKEIILSSAIKCSSFLELVANKNDKITHRLTLKMTTSITSAGKTQSTIIRAMVSPKMTSLFCSCQFLFSSQIQHLDPDLSHAVPFLPAMISNVIFLNRKKLPCN